ncbi:hypothetical protein JNB_16784 [Janibacter sp. HTCC2649]|uniref:DUF6153 family protein n=1 Tax=Janibacter sp. HTCC2649 TaxID=313589 RepID=UPI00006711F2|nr:DUF6153 family protein [Janibacter sp. HTCC2649]EAP97160.1 hypothetical protein JNB_16784 [Janibacter sp. HTCC2649]
MSNGERPQTTVRYALWLVGLFALLAGIVGMHGLNSHGAMAAEEHPPAHSVVAGHGGAARGTIDDAMVVVVDEMASPVASLVVVAVAAGPSGTDGGMGGMSSMCVAILVLALAILLRLLGAAPGLLTLARTVQAPVGSSAPHARDPDPPSLIHLSIQRC